MREIKKHDESRQADITIMFNNDDEIIGIRIEPFKSIPIIDFNLDRLLRPQMIMRPPGFPPMPRLTDQQVRETVDHLNIPHFTTQWPTQKEKKV